MKNSQSNYHENCFSRKIKLTTKILVLENLGYTVTCFITVVLGDVTLC